MEKQSYKKYIYIATYVVLESFLSKILLAQESNNNYATEAEEKLIKKGYIFFPPKIIKPKKIESISSINENKINNKNNDAALFNPNILNNETFIKNDISLTFQQQESEVSRLAAIQKNAEENKKISISLEEENRNASNLAIQALSEKQIARAKQLEIDLQENQKKIELDLLEKKNNELSLIKSQKEFEDARLAAILHNSEENRKLNSQIEDENRIASELAMHELNEKQIARAKQIEIEHEEHRKQIEIASLEKMKSIDDIIQSKIPEISYVKNIDIEKENDNSSLLNKYHTSNSLKIDKKNKFEFFYGKGSLNEVGIRFLSDTKNSVEIIYADSNAMLTNYNDIASISGSIADNSVNLYVNLGYNYSFNSKKVKINYLREINENTFFKSGLSFSSVEHDLNVYGTVTSTYNNVSTSPITYSNSNYIKLDFVAPYLGLEYQKEISAIGLFIYGNIGIEYTPPSTFDSVSSVIDGKFNSYSSITSDINSIKRNVAKYQEIKLYSVGIKYKF